MVESHASQNAPMTMRAEKRSWRMTKTGKTFLASASEGRPGTDLEADVVLSCTVFDGM